MSTETKTTTSKKELLRLANLVLTDMMPKCIGLLEDEEGCNNEEHILRDTGDIAELAVMIFRGRIKDAYKLWRKFDTVIRECIPNEVYEFLKSDGASDESNKNPM